MLARVSIFAWLAVAAPVSVAAIGHYVPDKCRSSLWTARLDGKELCVASARTCDQPFSGWGFHQGGEYAFASFEMDSPVSLAVRTLVPRNIGNVRIQPQGVPVSVSRVYSDTIELTVSRPCCFSVEPDGRESPILVFAMPPLSDAPRESGGKVRVFGPGWHDAGRIELSDGETLYLKAGAFVKGGVFAKGDNIRICGYGVLDGTDYLWRKGPVGHVVQLKECRNVTVEGITVRGAYHWTIVPIGCDGVRIRNVKLCGGRVQNDDGVDPCNSRNVLIENCFFRTDDDCVAIKGTSFGEKYGAVENITVRGCTFWSDHARNILIGHESRAPFMRNIVFEDCVAIRSRLSSILMEPGEDMRIENVRFRRMRICNDLFDPDYRVVTMRPCVNAYMKRKIPGHIDGVVFEDVSASCPLQTNNLIRIENADADHQVRDVTFTRVILNGTPCDTASRLENGRVWLDEAGHPINAHGGGVIRDGDAWYWFGEHKIYGHRGNKAHVGVHCYSSRDLVRWADKGIALAVSDVPGHDIEDGCIMERPKVLKCPRTGRYVMYFHLELKGMGYDAARTGIAVSDVVQGPYRFLSSLRPNGQMSRDMTLFADDDGYAYHVFASESNATLRIVRLSDDYLSHSAVESRVAIGDFSEAPAICKKDGWYYMLGSGCTGWKPNAARLYRSRSILGTWERLGNPCTGVNPLNGLGPDKTWGGQSTFILKVSENLFIAMFDIWKPDNAIDGRYVWGQLRFKPDNTLEIPWCTHAPSASD